MDDVAVVRATHDEWPLRGIVVGGTVGTRLDRNGHGNVFRHCVDSRERWGRTDWHHGWRWRLAGGRARGHGASGVSPGPLLLRRGLDLPRPTFGVVEPNRHERSACRAAQFRTGRAHLHLRRVQPHRPATAPACHLGHLPAPAATSLHADVIGRRPMPQKFRHCRRRGRQPPRWGYCAPWGLVANPISPTWPTACRSPRSPPAAASRWPRPDACSAAGRSTCRSRSGGAGSTVTGWFSCTSPG